MELRWIYPLLDVRIAGGLWMKAKVMMLFTLVMLFTLTGCSAHSNEAQKPEVTQKQNKPEKPDRTEKPTVINEEKLTLGDMLKALKAEGIEMFPKKVEKDWILNEVQPERFSVTRLTEKVVHPEFISIYVYDSAQARSEGLDDFNAQTEQYNMQMPNIYEHKNVLIFYWHREPLNQADNAKFHKQINKAIEHL